MGVLVVLGGRVLCGEHTSVQISPPPSGQSDPGASEPAPAFSEHHHHGTHDRRDRPRGDCCGLVGR